MSFRPFGDPFEIASPLTPERLKAVIRARRKPWFETTSGARGWIAGPFICLWLSVFDRYGPMLIGRISPDGAGSKVNGLAGSDLNGLLSVLLVIPIGLFALWMLFLEQGSIMAGLLASGLLIGLLAVNLWVGHVDRKQAEPLLRFVRNAASPGTHSGANSRTEPELRDGIEMDVSGVLSKGRVTAGHIRNALGDMSEGDAGRHFRAEPLTARRAGQAADIPFDDALAALLAWASANPAPEPVRWRRVTLRNRRE